MFYYEQRQFDGRWMPRKSPRPPSVRSSEGSVRQIRCVRAIERPMQHLTLAQLQAIYSRDGYLQAAHR